MTRPSGSSTFPDVGEGSAGGVVLVRDDGGHVDVDVDLVLLVLVAVVLHLLPLIHVVVPVDSSLNMLGCSSNQKEEVCKTLYLNTFKLHENKQN